MASYVHSLLRDVSEAIRADRYPLPDSDECRERLRRFAKTILSISIFFWLWAAYNTRGMEVGFDLGVFSFFGTIASSGILLHRRCGEHPGKIIRAAVLLTHLTVSANYALGLMFALTVGDQVYIKFATYCSVFIVLWLGVAVIGWRLITALQESAGTGIEGEGEELDSFYKFGGEHGREYSY